MGAFLPQQRPYFWYLRKASASWEASNLFTVAVTQELFLGIKQNIFIELNLKLSILDLWDGRISVRTKIIA